MARGSVERAGAYLAYEDVGEGPAIVLMHSFLCDRHMWSAQVPVLAAAHRVINLDLRGHGESSRAEPGVTLYDLVDDVVAVLDHLGVERAVWGGLSIGGMIALRAALTVPSRVQGLIVANGDAGPEKSLTRLRYRAMAAGARLFGLRPFAHPTAKLMFGRSTHRSRRKLIKEWNARIEEIDLPSVLALLPALTERDDLSDRLGAIETPALVIVGAEDVSLPPERSERIAAALPNAELVVIEKSGHLSAVERPAQVNKAMLRFLEAQAG